MVLEIVKKGISVVISLAGPVRTRVDALSSSDAEVLVYHDIIAGTIIAKLRGTDRNAFVAVYTLVLVDRDNLA